MNRIDELRHRAQEQQRQAVEASAPLFVQACPGAGKTRVIVDRHLLSDVAPQRRGRAVASFTNVACNEIRQRCHELGRPDLVRFPHFVGTIDTFIWLYLVRPFLPADRTWRRIDSWDRIRAAVTVPERIPLSAFLFRDQLRPRTAEARLLEQAATLSLVRKLERENRIDQAQVKAVAARKRYVEDGYVTGHEVRVMAIDNLQKRPDDVLALIKTRFHEVIIDEAQDCSSLDLTILKYLRDGSVPLIFVGDPDQAIYEFRGADPEQVRAFGTTLGKRIDLTGNWRSNPAICALSSTLHDPRHDRPADEPIGPNHDDPTAIMLLPISGGTVSDAVAEFQEQANGLGIPADQQLVLAHSGQALPDTARGRAQPPAEPSGTRLAWAAGTLADPTSGQRQREAAYELIERAMLRYWYGDTDDQSVEALCEAHLLDRVQFRRAAARFGVTLPSVETGTLTAWCSAANNLLKQHPPTAGLQRRTPQGSINPGKSGDQLPRMVAKLPAPTTAASPRASVIHQVKGEQVDAVLLIIPNDRRAEPLIEAWTAGNFEQDLAESLRVLYVAATRARRLLAIAVPENRLDTLRNYLATQGVPIQG